MTIESSMPPSAIRLVRLRWRGETDDFGVAVVPEVASLADARRSIATQFQGEPSAERLGGDQYRFMMQDAVITEVQEKLIPIDHANLVLVDLTDSAFGQHSLPDHQSGHGPEQRPDVLFDGLSLAHPLTAPDADTGYYQMIDDVRTDTSDRRLSPEQIVVSFDGAESHTAPSRHSRTNSLRRPMELSARIHVSGSDLIIVRTMEGLLMQLDALHAQEQAIAWVDICCPNSVDLKRIGNKLKLHPLTIEDICSADTRQKVEGFRAYMLVVLHSLDQADREDTLNLNIIVSNNTVVTLHMQESRTQVFESIRHGLRKAYGKRLPSSSVVVHSIIDCIVDYDMGIVNRAVHEMEALEELVYMLSSREQTDLMRRMGMVRKKLTILRQSLWSRRDMIHNLMSNEWRQFLMGFRMAFFRDVLDHVLTMIQQLEVATAMLDSLQNTYLAKVSIEVAETSNNINVSMQKVSTYAMIMLPMTFVTGLFGMNVAVPWQPTDENSYPYAFSGILIGMFCVSFPIYVYCKRNRFL